MISKVNFVISKILSDYQSGDDLEKLLAAKEMYFELTGMLNDDDEDYEQRMNCFNEWFVFDHELPTGERVIEKYLNNNDVDRSIATAMTEVSFSLFDYDKRNLKKQIVLKDYLNDKKVILPKDHPSISLVQDDLFLGRIIVLNEESYLLSGVRMLPGSVKSILKKQCKKVRKAKDEKLKLPFLLQIEHLQTKLQRYSHIEPSKIFVF